MSAREHEPIHSEPVTGAGLSEGDVRETHPAFGVASVTRASGSPRPLFQSDLQHSETMILRVHRADRTRSLHRDWTFPRQELIEIEMSLSQWGALVSSVGLGSGVPVTIRSTETEPLVANLPYQPRIANAVAETKGAVRRLLEHAVVTLGELEDAITEKRGIRAIRDALGRHRSSVTNAANNAGFTVKSLAETTEGIVAQARADIEAHILEATRITGADHASIEAPTIDIPEIEQ
ncbi:hypothetical protein QDA03_gp30 [Microbacterium phage Terij]|uniref:Uncharacterized protein n=1 Tax=Microbacterium phage Terij TaxID=2686229 RepID=A0A6B9LCY3_9CAUD|nr:hypothetical protein QDA03_gp30 [Microbacterium phage Terij]QHB37211.1 hypothetical protein SEA_TERIJ_77 [Microbacterium phage Terij]